MSYYLIIENSSLIVEGVIDEVGDDSYTLNITHSLKGQKLTKINVILWKEWTCDRRFGELKTGTRVLLFLKKDESGHYQVIQGSEGELIANADKSVNRNYYHDYPDIDEISEGVLMYLKCLKYHEEDSGKYFELLVSKEDFEYAMKNTFFKYIADEINRIEIPIR